MNGLKHWFWAWCLCPALWLAAGRAHAQTVVWADGFETDAASRWSVTSPWKIGSPTAGPPVNAGYRTHSGTTCASTQGYGVNKDVRLICTNYNGDSSLLVPSADQFPQLRFWQWFNFGNSLGYVEISTDDGQTWTQLSPTYGPNITGSGVWSRPAFDLSDYADENVLIAFHFTTGGVSGNGLGWFVDDVEVVAGSPGLSFPEGFESGLGDWSVDAGTWEVGKPTSGPGTAHTGINCAATVLAGNYGNNVDSRLVSPPFTVPAASPALRYWQWYSLKNALAFVEVNNGFTGTINTTNVTITVTTNTSLNTNIYQFFGAALAGYDTPLFWNSAIGGWTNATQAMGVVNDLGVRAYYYEAGSAPLSSVGIVTDDYRGSILPVPSSLHPTNILALQGMLWNSPADPTDNPIGYFSTNYSYTYQTNVSVTTTIVNWQTLPQTTLKSVGTAVLNSGNWISNSVDLSAYAGQTIQLAFHFTSGGIYSASGWYVDDLSLAAAPELTVPTNQIISFGQTFTNKLGADNPLAPASVFTFALAKASTNAVIETNGVVIWTNTLTPPGTYLVNAKVTDNQSPPFATTNSFSVTVLPLPSQLVFTNAVALAGTNGSQTFKLTVNPRWTNLAWVVQATTNLNGAATNWVTIFTNKPGMAGAINITDGLATNFLQRYYRAVFQ